MQPFVIAADPLQNLSAYVYINEHKYLMSSLEATVDSCFKSFYVLSAQYPVDCKSVGLFLQKYLYEIDDKRTCSKSFVVEYILWTALEPVPTDIVEESTEENDSEELNEIMDDAPIVLRG